MTSQQWKRLGITMAASFALWVVGVAAPGRVMAVCGDSVVDGNEQCDDGNTNDYDACKNDCTLNKCGNGNIDAGEDCDDGGVCQAGTNAGQKCPANVSGGVDCGAGVWCKPYGGDGCAANCIPETRRPFVFDATLTYAKIQLATIPLPNFTLVGSQVLTTSRHPDANGNYAVVIKAADVTIDKIPTPLNLCACVRGVAAKTCGGVQGGRDCSKPETICPPEEGACLFVHGEGNSASGFIGCGANGISPLNIDIARDHNTRFTNPADPCTAAGAQFDKNTNPSPHSNCNGGGNDQQLCFDESYCPGGACELACNGPEVLTYPAAENPPPGSAFVINSLGITTIPDYGTCDVEPDNKICIGGTNEGEDCTPNNPNAVVCDGGTCLSARTQICVGGNNAGADCTPIHPSSVECDGGTCLPAKGADGIPCNADDQNQAAAATVPLTSGTASSRILNANDILGALIAPEVKCGPTKICAAKVTGTPFNCAALAASPQGGVGSAQLVSAFPALDNSNGDLLVTDSLAAVAEAVCVGDCNRDHKVTVDELVKGVNIALGTTSFNECPQFDTNNDHKVTVDELVKGVNNALNGCGA